MSHLTPCNFCNLRSYRRWASEQGKVITLRPAPKDFAPKGIDVMMHAEGEQPTEKHWTAWFMALTDHCCC